MNEPKNEKWWEKDYEKLDFGIITPTPTAELLHYSKTIKDFISLVESRSRTDALREAIEEVRKKRDMAKSMNDALETDVANGAIAVCGTIEVALLSRIKEDER